MSARIGVPSRAATQPTIAPVDERGPRPGDPAGAAITMTAAAAAARSAAETTRDRRVRPHDLHAAEDPRFGRAEVMHRPDVRSRSRATSSARRAAVGGRMRTTRHRRPGGGCPRTGRQPSSRARCAASAIGSTATISPSVSSSRPERWVEDCPSAPSARLDLRPGGRRAANRRLAASTPCHRSSTHLRSPTAAACARRGGRPTILAEIGHARGSPSRPAMTGWAAARGFVSRVGPESTVADGELLEPGGPVRVGRRRGARVARRASPGRRRLSYRALDDRANRLAHVLSERGVGPRRPRRRRPAQQR